jgi:hypothetical protein
MNSGRAKIVGRRRDAAESSPEHFFRRAESLQRSVDELNPFPRPRGFIFKARTREAYDAWRRAQANPRLWP